MRQSRNVARAVMIHLATGDIEGFESFVSTLSSRLRQTIDRSDFDYLVNNAGIGIHASFTETTGDQFRSTLQD